MVCRPLYRKGYDAQLATLTTHDLTGAMLQAGVQSYFALNQTEDYIAGLQADAYDRPFMSYGSFSLVPIVLDGDAYNG